MDEEKHKKIEEKYRKRKVQLIVMFIIFLLLAFAALYYVGILEKKEGPYINIVEIITGEKQEGNTEETVSAPLSPLDVIPKDTVLMIVQNPDYSVPSEFEFSKREVVLEYISECREVADLDGKVSCLDVYFLNNIPHLKPMRENCTEGNVSCLDEYYLEASMYGERAYCDIISTEALKEECNGE